jgi:flagellar basal-body rod modification protein FlgD
MTTAASAMPATVTTLPVGTQMPSTTAARTPNGSMLTQNAFLQLLTTQLQKQNPLNPLSPSDFAAELAQFSTATGVQTLNTTLQTTSGVQLAGLVGHNVAVPGNALLLGQGGTAAGAFNLSAAARDVSVAITDASGNLVAAIDLGPMPAGSQQFTWNGQGMNGTAAPPGAYSYRIVATGQSGAAVTPTTYSVLPVTAVVLGGQAGPQLNLGGGAAPVALSAVAQVF